MEKDDSWGKFKIGHCVCDNRSANDEPCNPKGTPASLSGQQALFLLLLVCISVTVLVVGLAALLIGGAAGDFAMYKELRKLPDDWLVKDDPELPRLYVYAPDKFDALVE